MKLKKLDSLTKVLGSYEVSVLLEIIRSECAEVPGFAYLTKKGYLAEQMRKTNLFEFEKDSVVGASSPVIRSVTQAIKMFEVARVVEVGDALSKDTRNFCGEVCGEYIALVSEQVADQYLNSMANDPDFIKWQKAIDEINRHPGGKDWHALSVAVYMHSHRHADKLRTISEIRRQVMYRKMLLPEGIFKDASDLLRDLGLLQPK